MDERFTLPEVVALSGILTFAAFLSMAFFYGPNHADQLDNFIYSALAEYSLQPNFWMHELNAFSSTKLIEIFGIRSFYSMLGVSNLSESLLGVVSFLLTIVVIFFIGKNLGGRRAALLSSFFYSFMPLAVVEASASSDDIVMVLFASLTVLFLALATKRKDGRYYFLSGFVGWFGMLSSIEEVIILALPALLLIFLFSMSRKSERSVMGLAWFISGVLIAALFIMLISFALSGDAIRIYNATVSWYNISWLARSHPPIPAFAKVVAAMFPLGAPDNLIGFGYFGYAAMLSAVYLVVKKREDMVIPLVWFIMAFAYLSFGTSSLSGYHFIQYKLRYTLLFVPALALVLGLGVDTIIVETKFTRKKQEKVVSTIIRSAVLFGIVLLLVSSVFLVRYNQYVNYADMYSLINISQSLLALPANTPIYVNLNLAPQLLFYMRYSGSLYSYILQPCGFLVGNVSNSIVTGGMFVSGNISKGSLMIDSQYDVLNQSCESFELQLDPALPEWLSRYRTDYNYSWGWAELYRLGR